jgi:hypothetical protein
MVYICFGVYQIFLQIFFNNEKYAWFTVEQSEDSVGTCSILYVKIKQNFLTEKTSVLMNALISFYFQQRVKILNLIFYFVQVANQILITARCKIVLHTFLNIDLVWI